MIERHYYIFCIEYHSFPSMTSSWRRNHCGKTKEKLTHALLILVCSHTWFLWAHNHSFSMQDSKLGQSFWHLSNRFTHPRLQICQKHRPNLSSPRKSSAAGSAPASRRPPCTSLHTTAKIMTTEEEKDEIFSCILVRKSARRRRRKRRARTDGAADGAEPQDPLRPFLPYHPSWSNHPTPEKKSLLLS